MKTKENIDTDNYYFYQVFTDDYESLRGVVFAENTKDAENKINKMLNQKNIGNNRREINLYHKNYKRDSRKEVERGNYLE